MDNEEFNDANNNDSTYVPVTRGEKGRGKEDMIGRGGVNPLWAGWDPFEAFGRAFAEITDMFESFSNQITGLTVFPVIEISRADGRVVVRMSISGLDSNNIEVEVFRDHIRIAGKNKRSGEYRSRDDRVYRREASFNSFFKVLPLPVYVKQDEAKIEYRGDVMFITIPEA